MTIRSLLCFWLVFNSIVVCWGAPPDAEQTDRPGYQVRSLRGEVVWLADALARRHDVKTLPEARERMLGLVTPGGELYPLIEDKRGGAFRRDKRLRDVKVELLVRQHEGSPLVQVIKVFALEKDGKYELDYWCEICAIAMFELKACDCCQGPIELRRRLSSKFQVQSSKSANSPP